MVMPETGHLPPEKPPVDIRWQNPRPWHTIPDDPADRTRYAIEQQCLQARIPGYKGYIPSVKSRSIFMRTPSQLGDAAALEQSKVRQDVGGAALVSGGGMASDHAASSPAPAGCATATVHPDEHPLGKSRADIVRSYSVPTIPGYAGYVPAKIAENIHGGGLSQTLKTSNRVIAERLPPLDPNDPRTAADLARIGLGDDHSKHHRVASTMGAHCARPIPGYMGHVPRIGSESVFGARFTHANTIAKDFCDDRVFGEHTQHHHSAPPQVPKQRQLRL